MKSYLATFETFSALNRVLGGIRTVWFTDAETGNIVSNNSLRDGDRIALDHSPDDKRVLIWNENGKYWELRKP